MTLLERIHNKNIPVNWSTIREGWMGPRGNHPRLLSLDEVREFASNRLEEGEDSKEECFIAGADQTDLSKVTDYVARLANNEEADQEKEVRKWRFVLLELLMEELSDNPLYGSIALLEFWGGWSFPADGPLKDLSDVDRESFSRDGFEEMKSLHQTWMENELKQLQVPSSKK